MDITGISAETLGSVGGLGFIVAIIVQLVIKPALVARGITKDNKNWGLWVFGLSLLVAELLAFAFALILLGPMTAVLALNTAVLGFGGAVIGSGMYEAVKNALKAANTDGTN